MALSPTWSGGRIFLCRVSFHADSYFGIHSTPMLLQYHVKDPNAIILPKVHVAGYSQMHMHRTYVALHK